MYKYVVKYILKRNLFSSTIKKFRIMINKELFCLLKYQNIWQKIFWGIEKAFKFWIKKNSSKNNKLWIKK